MADVNVRKIPDWVIETFRSRAAASGRTLEEELRSLLIDVARAGRVEFRAQAKAFQESLRTQYGEVSDSTPGIVEDREQRG